MSAVINLENDPLEIQAGPKSQKPHNGFLPVSTLEMNLARTLGKILTILDASIADPRQNKACKDLIRGELNNLMNYLSDISGPSNEIRPFKKLQPVFDHVG